MKQYAVYKGEKLVTMGTAAECAEELNVTRKTIWWLTAPANEKRDKGNRLVVVKMEDDEE